MNVHKTYVRLKKMARRLGYKEIEKSRSRTSASVYPVFSTDGKERFLVRVSDHHCNGNIKLSIHPGGMTVNDVVRYMRDKASNYEEKANRKEKILASTKGRSVLRDLF